MEPITTIILSVIALVIAMGLMFSKNPAKASLGTQGTFLVSFVFIALAVWGLVVAVPSVVSTADIINFGNDDVDSVSDYGVLSITLSDGVVNDSTGVDSTTTEDYLNDEQDFMTFYSADANIIDGEEYGFNATIERSKVAEDVNVKVTCSVPDKELSGVTATNLIEKTSGKIDLTFVGSGISSTGKHIDDNSVYTYVTFAEGDGVEVIQVNADQEETYHDGMTDLDDYVDIVCDAEGVPFTARVYANS